MLQDKIGREYQFRTVDAVKTCINELFSSHCEPIASHITLYIMSHETTELMLQI